MDQKAERKAYLLEKVDPILEGLLEAVLRDRPDNVREYMVEFLAHGQQEASEGQQCASSSQQFYSQLQEIRSATKRMAGRMSFCSQSFGHFNKRISLPQTLIPKTAFQVTSIMSTLKKSWLFSGLAPAQLNLLISVLTPLTAKAGHHLITQGSQGDFLYIVEEGMLQCYKEKEGCRLFLLQYGPGDYFGELALLYKCKRQASILALRDCKLWVLERRHFKEILQSRSIERRQLYHGFLNEVQLLDSLNAYEKGRLAESLVAEDIKAGQEVVKQGQVGKQFYIIEKGKLSVFKDGILVKKYGPGDYFGEISLIEAVPRQATVKCETDATVLKISKQAFARLLGPLQSRMLNSPLRFALLQNMIN